MKYKIKKVRDHYEVFNSLNEFVCSTDTYIEACKELDEKLYHCDTYYAGAKL